MSEVEVERQPEEREPAPRKPWRRRAALRLLAVVIEGLTPQSKPFLKAKLITVKFPWWIALDWQWRKGLSRHIVVESVEMTDWDMFLETFPGGRHNLPRLKPKKS